MGDPRGRLGLVAAIAALLLVEASYGLCLQDDAYISFRYAQNAAEGLGLVYNPGERVEGYTNFLWTALFIPVEAAGVDPGPVAAILGAVCSALLLHATWGLGGGRWLAPALVATFPGLGLEAVQGLETVFYAWLVTLAVAGGPRWALAAGAAALTRPEGFAVFGLLWLLRRGWTDLRSSVVFTAMTAPHLVFRWVYYGDIVPNTFHAKVGDPGALAGAAWTRGLRYLGELGADALPFAVAALVGLGVGLRRREPALRAPAALLLFVLAYIVAVGGDFKGTGRFLIPALPAAAVLAQGLVPAGAGRAAVGLLLASALWSVPALREMSAFADRFAEDLVLRRRVGEALAARLPPDTQIAVHAAGILPYYARLPTLDMWGLTDPHIARAPVEGLGTGTAGHERHDYGYVLSQRPQIILPERGLVTDMPVALPDPPEFPADFSAWYAPGSLALPGGGHLNAWLLRRSPAGAPVGVVDHPGHRDEVDELPHKAAPEGAQPEQAADPAPHVEAVQAGQPEEAAQP